MKTTFDSPVGLLALAATAVLLLQGCSTASKVPDDGKPAEVVFPQRDEAWLKEGRFPNVENLRAVASGATKTSSTACSVARISAKACSVFANGTTSSISRGPKA